MQERSLDEKMALERARRDAERLSLEPVEVGIYRMTDGRIEARVGDRHLIAGVRIERYARGKSAEL